MQHEREKWKDDVLRSIHGIQRAKPPHPELYHRILEKIERAKHIRHISMRRVWLAAAGLAILFSFNILVLANFSAKQIQAPQANSTPYELSNANFQLY